VTNVGTLANDTLAAVQALFKATGTATAPTAPVLGAADWTTAAATTLKTQTNALRYDHVLLVKNATTGSAEVYTVDNGVVTDQGLLTVLGLGSQTAGGTALDMTALLNSGSFVPVPGALGGAVTTLPTVTLSASSPVSVTGLSVDEGTSVTYTATLSSAVAPGTLIPYTLGGNATLTADYTVTGQTVPSTTGSITVGATGLTGTLVLPVVADATTEAAAESVSVTLAAVAGVVNLGAVSSVSTTINDTSLTGSTPATTVAVNSLTTAAAAANTFTATAGNDTYTIAAGAYTATIANFDQAGADVLSFFTGASISVTPDLSQTDGLQQLTAIDPATGATTTIILTGLTAAQDGGAFNTGSFITTFGAGSLV
jgi:hypothetical protein